MSASVLPAFSIVSPLLVGRDMQLAGLQNLLDQALGHVGQVALISSEAGLGKTRLVSEISNLARRSGFETFLGECFEQDQYLPYSFWTDLLRRHLSRQMSEADLTGISRWPAELSAILPELQEHIPGPRFQPAADPELEKQRLYLAMEGFFTQQMAAGPFLVVIEDIHWSDAASLEFLRYWLRRAGNRPVLHLLTYRSDELSEPLAQFLIDLTRKRMAHEFALKPLDTQQVELMLRAIFAQEKPISREFVLRIHQLTEGNPFFIEEVLKSLLNSGGFSYEAGKWERESIDHLQIPPNVHIAVQRRIIRLKTQTRDLLNLAAVIGRRFDYPLLIELTTRNKMEIIAELHELVDANLIAEEGDGQFTFRHALTREAIYDSLFNLERVNYHHLIASTLERLHAQDLENVAAQLSYHYYAIGNWQEVFKLSQIAGERAFKLHAPREALRFFSQALESAGRSDYPPQSRLYRQRGKTYEVLGGFDNSRLDYERALELAHQENDQLAIWECLIDLGFLWSERDYKIVGDYFERALALARVLENPVFIATSLNRLGNWYTNREITFDAIKHHKQALEIYSTIQDQQGLGETLDLIGMAISMGGSFLDSFTYFERAVAFFEQAGNQIGMSSGLAVMAENCPSLFIDASSLFACPIPKSISYGEKSLELAQEIGWLSGSAYTHAILSVCLGASGDYAAAFEHARMAQGLAEEIDHLQWSILAGIALGVIYLELFSFSDARFELEQAYSRAVELNSPFWIRYAAGHLGTAYLSEDQPGQAARVVESALGSDDSRHTLSQRLCWVVRLRLALVKRNPAQAIEIAERLLAEVSTAETDPVLPWQYPPRLLMLYGEALWMAKRFSDSEITLKSALQCAQAADARSIAWRIHLLLGKCYHSQRLYEAAENELATARNLLAGLAANIPSEELRQNFINKTGALFPSPSAATPIRNEKRRFGGLTRRERQIAWHISQGHSNRQIADDLILSERTVERHVSHILDKLGFESRFQVISWALQNDLSSDLG